MEIQGSFQRISVPSDTEVWILRKGKNLLIDNDFFTDVEKIAERKIKEENRREKIREYWRERRKNKRNQSNN